MEPVKTQVRRLDAWVWHQRKLRKEGREVEPPSLHMCLAGPPGTGKTTVARIIGRILEGYGLLEKSAVLEVGRSDLVASFEGQTSGKTSTVIKAAIGGVLFIDEAYSLSQRAGHVGADFGREAITTLVAGMENHRKELCVIVAGYADEMKRFLDANAGLASRISRRIDFPEFEDDELVDVFRAMLAAEDRTCDESIPPMLANYVARAKASLPPKRWGNARSVRNMLEAAVENQAVRLRQKGEDFDLEELLHLTADDFGFTNDAEVSVY